MSNKSDGSSGKAPENAKVPDPKSTKIVVNESQKSYVQLPTAPAKPFVPPTIQKPSPGAEKPQQSPNTQPQSQKPPESSGKD